MCRYITEFVSLDSHDNYRLKIKGKEQKIISIILYNLYHEKYFIYFFHLFDFLRQLNIPFFES